MKNKGIWVGLVLGVVLFLIGFWVFFSGGPSDLPEDPGSGNGGDSALQALPIPELLEDENPEAGIASYNLVARHGTMNFFDGVETLTMGYNGNYLGPVIKLQRGEEVHMKVTNELKEPTSVHWHGLEVPGTEDGGPHQPIASGGIWEPSFTIDQPAATLWFHPHVIGTTATQVYYGLAGMLIIEDENSQSLGLPSEYGVNDIPLILQDRSFNDNGSFLYYDNMMDGAFGEHLMVNGAITPYLDVKPIKIRFRILNGANARNYYLQLSDGKGFQQIASDGGLLEKPVEKEGLFLSPGERAEIVIDFSSYDDGDVVAFKTGEEEIMTFRIGGDREDPSTVPETLAVIEKMEESSATGIKTIELDGMGHMVTLNGRQFDMDRIDDNVVLDDVEIWEITTTGRMMMGTTGHPFHIHGTQFQVLSRNGAPPDPNEQGWKDTVFVGVNETVRVIVQFQHKGVYMYHCHILEHEEAGMMGQLEVK
ncbi:multicopper oxidase family protein [Alkalibacter rhizosphaerae]|nr:multicopper oxidase domain-containing protein [Alkalibacter rhizosphaerae]